MTLARSTVLLVAFGISLGCGRSNPLFPRQPVYDDGGVPVEPDGGIDAGSVVDAGPILRCVVSVAPGALDFGTVALGSAVNRVVTVSNTGTGDCEFTSVALDGDSDAEFSLSPGTASTLEVPVGEHIPVSVVFAATSTDLPRARTGTLRFQQASEQTVDSPPDITIPLSATIQVGCNLQVAPNPLDYGNVPLNTSLTDALTLTNSGDEPCEIADVALDPTTSPLFSLPASQVLSFEVAAQTSENISVTFDGDDSNDPHLRTGILNFNVSQSATQPAFATLAEAIPLEAFINTACVAGSQWIYTVDTNGTFSLFDPLTLSYTDLGTLSCPDTGTPFSMAVDQNAVAWVEYSFGNIYRVDTNTVACTATSYQVDSQVAQFGMSFVFQPTTGLDTLYVVGAPLGQFGNTTPPAPPSTLATISFPSLTLTPIAPFTLGEAELTGTGDGQLWAFVPGASAAGGDQSILAQIDPTTGNVLTTFNHFGNIGATPTSWAVKFWGGSFWLFLDSTVYQVDRTTGDVINTVDFPGREIVGAGVSTCAPVQ